MDNNRNREPQNNGDQNKQKKNKIITVLLALVAALIFTSVSTYLFDSATKEEVTYSYFMKMLEEYYLTLCKMLM